MSNCLLETERLALRPPVPIDAEAIFEAYAGDREVGKYLAWATHKTIDDTHAFLAFSQEQWADCPAGPLVVLSKIDGTIIGSTGLTFDSDNTAAAGTGYVFAKHVWGRGYASEALGAMMTLARDLRLERLYAHCYPAHTASRRVLERAGFKLEGTLSRFCEFPNLEPGVLQDVVSYGWKPD